MFKVTQLLVHETRLISSLQQTDYFWNKNISVITN